MITQELQHHYRQARAHQMATYGPSSAHIQMPDGRWIPEGHTGGGAAIGFHAVAAYWSARRSIHFRAGVAQRIEAHKKRSAAAKRGWKTRRADHAV